MRMLSIVMPLPYGGSPIDETKEMIQEAGRRFAKLGNPIWYQESFGLDQAQARAELAAKWESERGWKGDLFCLDNDNHFAVEWFEELTRCEDFIIAGAYKGRDKRQLWNTSIGEKEGDMMPMEKRDGHRMVQVNSSGFGSVRIRGIALKEMQGAYPELRFKSRATGLDCWDLWRPAIIPDIGPEATPRRYHDDSSFFWRARQIGLKIWCPVDWEVAHREVKGKFSVECRVLT